ncbi:MAG: YcbK family protein [Deltaproteobacteria bacterium]|nr:YcbK family protein [Deltaproteobacteria bacterium]
MRTNRLTIGLIASFFLVFLLSSSFADGGKPKDRYFFSGDGSIQLTNAKTGQSARIHYRLPDGSYPRDEHQRLNHLFGVPVQSHDSISLRLISLLDYIEDHYHQPIEIISGYRSPEYNEHLRAQGRLAAKASLHMEGMAADIRMRKVLSAEWFKTIKALNCCGVGYYHDNSLHVDTGPARYWDETTSKVRTNISEHNKQIMARTDQDIYLPGEIVELKLARLTDYPIGFASHFAIVHDGQTLKEFSFDGKTEECLAVREPEGRTIKWTIPSDFRPDGRIQIRVYFCEKPFPEMPEQIESNSVVIQRGT